QIRRREFGWRSYMRPSLQTRFTFFMYRFHPSAYSPFRNPQSVSNFLVCVQSARLSSNARYRRLSFQSGMRIFLVLMIVSYHAHKVILLMQRSIKEEKKRPRFKASGMEEKAGQDEKESEAGDKKRAGSEK